MAKKITPQQLMVQWSTIPSLLAVNILNFRVMMGKLAVRVFRQSFYLHRFNAPGTTAWPARKDHKPHDLLMETGSLYRSISYRQIATRKKEGVLIYTDPKGFAFSNRQTSQKHSASRNFCYAAIHNFGGRPNSQIDGEIDWQGATGAAGYIKRRQFMGHTPYIDEQLLAGSKIIFDGFPK